MISPSRCIGALFLVLAISTGAVAQRGQPRNVDAQRPEPPTVTGKVVGYEPEKSIALETTNRQGVKKSEFAIAKDKTRIELPPRIKEIRLGLTLSVWADKDDPKLAARIATGGSPPAMPAMRRPNNNRRPAAAPTTLEASSAPRPADPLVDEPAKRPAREPVAGLEPAGVAVQIDRHIDARLAAASVPASPTSDDAEFLRRVYLDITGVIPPAEKAAAFLDSRDADKRARLIDELLASPRYGWHFADIWCDRIAIKDIPIYRDPFIDWLSDRLNQGRGWDEVVFEMLTAEGKFGLLTRGRRLSTEDPQALLMVLNTEAGFPPKPNPAWLAAETGRLFLGVQLQCAECHDHPFSDAWKQTDFWGLAAFFGRLGAVNTNPGFRWDEAPIGSGQEVNIAIPATSLKNIGNIVPARLLDHEQAHRTSEPQLLRHALARWLTAPDNPYFARAAANRLWVDFFGRGLVNPVDDLRPDNPPSHPEVLQLLADELTKSNFDLKHLIRCLCLSRTYQRTSVPLAANEDDQDKFSHMAVRVMGPGVFYDCLAAATGFPALKVGLPERKTKLTVATTFTPREVFVDFFRSSQGEEADPLENTHGIPQALKLMNAAQLNGIAPVVERLAASGMKRDQLIEQLYLAALARRPGSNEVKLMTNFLDRRENANPEQGYSDLLWTLINSAEFVSNH